MLYFEIAPNLCLTLRLPEHAQEMFSVIDANRDHLREWLPWVDGTNSAEDSRQAALRALKAYGENREMHMTIWQNGRIVGAIGFNNLDWAVRSCEIGYWLAQSAQGQGIMTQSCRAVIDHAFTVWQMNRITIRANSQNARSRAVPERLGFKLEGTLRQNSLFYGAYRDTVVYGLLSADWNAQ